MGSQGTCAHENMSTLLTVISSDNVPYVADEIIATPKKKTRNQINQKIMTLMKFPVTN